MTQSPLVKSRPPHNLPPVHIHSQIAVIGGGPAGLRAAEVAATAGLQVTLYDGKPSVGRKFLVAGKGGLNLTHGESLDRFVTRYSGPDQPAGICVASAQLLSGQLAVSLLVIVRS